MPSRTAADISPGMWKQFRPFRAVVEKRPVYERITLAKTVAVAIAEELKTRFGATKVILFGSLARNDFHNSSDVDLAVWGVAPEAFYRAVAFATGFSEVFKVDLVDAGDCSESLLQHILREGIEL